jgi:hypothetical protein
MACNRDIFTFFFFTVSDLRLPQHGGPSLCIYIPQEQGGPVIPPGTGLNKCNSKSKSHCDWQSVGLSWCRAPSGAYDQKIVYWFNWRKLQSCLLGRPLWREVGSVVCQSVICVRSLSVCTVYLQNLLDRIKWSALCTVYTRPLSVQAQYSRLCYTTSSFRYHGSLRHLNGRMLDRRYKQVSYIDAARTTQKT